MRFHADLHIHSKYSRATSRDLDLEHLAHWGRRKGITVLATGDFTHPAWRAELKEKLIPAEPGLFRLRDEIEAGIAAQLPLACRTPIRFMLSVEISTIYKKGESTRKIHHLVYAPDLETAERITAALARIGNVVADGRPILGLDSRHLLEIVLAASPYAYLVPAHIWTPWFAVLGSRSGFDRITDCYGDLSDHIFAVETGLSSDPRMNWRLSFLDRYRLISNSDAHSPGKLGRETTLFDCALDYYAMRQALDTGEGYVGTVEFFPEEGKYHLDGHRKCGIRLTPKETLAHGKRCPVCSEPLTVGVLHRIEALADRPEAAVVPPPTAGEVTNLVPLPEILSEIAGVGPASGAVERSYDRLIAKLGAELSILGSAPLEDIARAESSLLAEAIARLRAGHVICDAGYDGEYGVIRLFEDNELKSHRMGGLLFSAPARPRKEPADPAAERMLADQASPPLVPAATAAPAGLLARLDEDQRRAAIVIEGALLITAGPGSGKTRTLAHRIAHMIAECGVPAATCLAITFTRRAAAEMAARLAGLLPAGAAQPAVHSFHSLGLAILRAHPAAGGLHRGFRLAEAAERARLLAKAMALSERKADNLLGAISKAKRTGTPANAMVAEALEAYGRALALRNLVDFDDLIGLAVQALTDPALQAHYRARFRWISVDEFQDVDDQQYRLVALLAPPAGTPKSNLCLIGDPNQAIYGFRGANAACFDRFRRDYPDAAVIALTRNYRSTGTIVTAATQVIAAAAPEAAAVVRDMQARITIHAAATERAEAEFIVETIEGMIGGHSFFSIDSGRARHGSAAGLSFGDFAVLYRTEAQTAALSEALARSGIPFRKHGHDALLADPAIRRLLEEIEAAAAGSLPAELDAAARRAVEDGLAVDAIEAARLRLTLLAQACGGDRARFADTVALAVEADFWDPRADALSLLTIHAAKGLEFPVVFITGLEDGLLPFHWGKTEEAALAEERRLFYVGITRAKDRLVLTRALRRLWRGRLRERAASPFLGDIEQALTEHRQAMAVRRKPEDAQLRLL
jgi:DNA helicase II / ATP-dependent DNA helicase PcrA